jgi:hypothetical protein
LRYANATLKAGDKANCVGGGDCDDFAILMSALVESVGGTTRIILARNNSTGGHAYTEVYLGQLNATGNQVEPIIDRLKGKFNTGKIYTHIDTDTKDVWLNLDWGPDEEGNTHPGGPFYQGDKHTVLCIRDKFVKTPLKLPEIPEEGTKDAIIQPKVAKLIVNETVADQSNLAEDWYKKCVALEAQGRYDEAAKACEEAIKLDTNFTITNVDVLKYKMSMR